MSFGAADLALRMDKYGKLSQQKRFVRWSLDGQGQEMGAWRDLPPETEGSFFLGMHYDERGFRLVGADGRPRVLGPGELGELLRDNPTLQDFTDITLIACESGRDIVTGQDGVRTNAAQTIADRTGKPSTPPPEASSSTPTP